MPGIMYGRALLVSSQKNNSFLGIPSTRGQEHGGDLRCQEMHMHTLRRWRHQSLLGQKSPGPRCGPRCGVGWCWVLGVGVIFLLFVLRESRSNAPYTNGLRTRHGHGGAVKRAYRRLRRGSPHARNKAIANERQRASKDKIPRGHMHAYHDCWVGPFHDPLQQKL